MQTKLLNTLVITGGERDCAPLVAFHPKQDWLITTADHPEKLTRIDCEKGNTDTIFTLGWEPISLSFDSRGSFLTVLGDSKIAILKFLANNKVTILTNQDHGNSIPENDSKLIHYPEDGCLWVFFSDVWQRWSLPELKYEDLSVKGCGERVLQASCTDENRSYIVTFDDEAEYSPQITLSRFDLLNGDLCFQIPFKAWQECIVSYDSRLVVFQKGFSKQKASVWDLESQKELQVTLDLFLGFGPMFCCDNRRLVTRPSEQSDSWTSLVVTDVVSNNSLTFDSLSPYRPQVFVSPNREVIATVANDSRHPVNETNFWDLSGNRLAKSNGHVGAGIFSPNGKWFASVSNSASEECSFEPQPGGTVRITNLI